MTVLAEKKAFTPEDLLTMPDGERYELVDGELVEKDMGAESSWIGGQLFARLESFNQEAKLGWVLPSDVGYQCFAEDARRVRKPDTSFIRQGRLPRERLPKGHVRIFPDLAVEVVSPNDLFSEVRRKVGEYLGAGVRLVWVVNPDIRDVEVWRADGSVTWFREGDELDGEDVLPGFRCRVGDLFPAGSDPADAGEVQPTHESCSTSEIRKARLMRSWENEAPAEPQSAPMPMTGRARLPPSRPDTPSAR